jgi:transposase InsO family protein
LEKSGCPQNVIIHSDRGSQYTSRDYADLSLSLDFTRSFSAKGCPFDNAPMESFNAILKNEEVYLNSYTDFVSAKIALFDYIEGFYNRNRIHSAIGFLSPAVFEAAFPG